MVSPRTLGHIHRSHLRLRILESFGVLFCEAFLLLVKWLRLDYHLLEFERWVTVQVVTLQNNKHANRSFQLAMNDVIVM